MPEVVVETPPWPQPEIAYPVTNNAAHPTTVQRAVATLGIFIIFVCGGCFLPATFRRLLYGINSLYYRIFGGADPAVACHGRSSGELSATSAPLLPTLDRTGGKRLSTARSNIAAHVQLGKYSPEKEKSACFQSLTGIAKKKQPTLGAPTLAGCRQAKERKCFTSTR
jgi:hypothetical protein